MPAKILGRFFKRQFSMQAPRVAVRPHVPWYLRWLGLAIASVLIAGLAWSTYDYGLELAGFRKSEATRLREELAATVGKQKSELDALSTRLATAERQSQIDRAALADMDKQFKALTQENASLKEDLALFQSLGTEGPKEGIAISRFRLTAEPVPGEHRYRLLLVQNGVRVKTFTGRLELVLNLQQDGRKVVLTLPGEAGRNAREYEVNFKFFQRVEGIIRIAPEAVLQSLQVRVFEKGDKAPRLTQNVSLS